ncbi:MAG: SIS domain-containing protein [Armatimonadetes bacterium]|nr:SIS domain-containing protein [Armatimonadota bacterium]
MRALCDYLDQLQGTLAKLPRQTIQEIAEILYKAYAEGQKVLLMGNGGSASTASHLACDLQKGIGSLKGKGFKALAITDSLPLLTAWGNDTAYDNIFVEQIQTWAQPGDIVIAISGSGNSPNILRGVQAAREKNAVTIGWAGFEGGKLKDLVDHCLVVPSDNMQRIEDIHLVIGHAIFTCLMSKILA